MGDRLWVDVRLSVPQRVVVYRGETAVRRMVASAGLPGQETPKGVYRLQNRGEQFFSWRYRQGGYYWVRFLGNYLFHSVPFDEQGRLLTEEEAKLGCPASHGCVRLSLDDARWFYDNVPDGTLVVVRE
ncbi:MAG: L,D-transpeptidase [Firmicutes bacterium]|nr:L,D-transpeptidase [Bacillota bacterium]